jgi:flagellar hook-associated protein 3 FlgL
MRVTQATTADNALYNLQKDRSSLDSLQEKIASGLNVNRPSDDPITARQLLELDNKIDKGNQYLGNITKSSLWLNMTDTALQGISDIIAQAKKVAGTITSGSSDQTVRDNAASLLTELKKQLVNMANTQLGDQYIFAGYKTDTPPFNPTDFTDNVYKGTNDDMNVEIDQNSIVAMNITGQNLLKGGTYGSIDILQTFDDLVTAINNNDVSGIQSASTNLDKSSDQITNADSDVASRLIRLDSAKTMITNNQNTLQNIYSDTQNVDFTKAAVELTQQQTAFQAALSSTARITQMSLLDYL